MRSSASSAPAITSWTCSGAWAFTKANAVSIESASMMTARALGRKQGGDRRRAAPASVETSTDCAPGPCSSWASRSQAIGSAGAVVVGDDDQLARARQRLDADLAEQAPLGLLDVGVARPDHQVDARHPLRPERERRDRLGAADRVDLLDAEDAARGQRGRVRQPVGPGGEQIAIPGTPATWAGTIAITALDG